MIGVPTPVAGVTEVVSIAVGPVSTCAIHRSGRVSCWGQLSGQYPWEGDELECQPWVLSPVTIPGIDSAVDVLIDHSVHVVLRSGHVVEWSNGCPRPGEPSPLPGVVPGIDSAVALSGNCVLRRGGEVDCRWSWHRGFEAVLGLDDAVDLASTGGRQTCAVRRSGEVWCWRDGSDQEAPSRAVRVAGIDDAIRIAGSDSHTLALRRSGLVSTWGLLDAAGGFRQPSSSVVTVAGVDQVVDVVDGDHTCAVRSDGSAWCWGSNRASGLGLGEQAWYGAAVDVPGLTDAVRVVSGHAFSCALRVGGRVGCWGRIVDSHQPTALSAFDGATSLVAGKDEVCAMMSHDGGVCRSAGGRHSRAGGPAKDVRLPRLAGSELFAVSRDDAGPAGASLDRRGRLFGWSTKGARPPLGGIEDIVQMASSDAGTRAILRSGKVLCWTRADVGAVKAVELPGMVDAVGVIEAAMHLYALSRTGLIYGVDRCDAPPIVVPNVADVVQLTPAKGPPFCVRFRSGKVACCDDAVSGYACRLGQPLTTLAGVDNAVDVSQADDHGCAVRANGHVVCWGDNTEGAVGRPYRDAAPSPVQIIPPLPR